MPSGYILPAEWAPQSAVLLTWPHDQSDWDAHLEAAENNFLEIASCISCYEDVIINCRSESGVAKIKEGLLATGANLQRFHFNILPSNDVWARDHGPITVIKDDRPLLLDFTFNGWGGKYPAELDNQITPSLYNKGLFSNAGIKSLDCVLEGGAIETDGEGVMLTTTDCLPLPSRNPGMTRLDFESMFKEQFGIHTVHWLTRGHLTGDDTDGHIDTIARFTNPQTIVFQGCEDDQDEHFDELGAMRIELEQLKQPNSEPYTLRALPLPSPIHNDEGQRLPASYANFLIINAAVLLPAYNDPADKIAAEILAGCFPGRKIHLIDCRALIQQFGSLHCVTMQIPAQVTLAQA